MMSPDGGGEPSGELADAINNAFGSFDAFKEEFKAAGIGQFGSGWAWLVLDGGKLSIMKTANADLPMKHGKKALFTVDVWEHAYYIDYRNLRQKFVETVLANLASWDFATENLKKG
jgi:Fe-Mn family superoxide dismutase